MYKNKKTQIIFTKCILGTIGLLFLLGPEMNGFLYYMTERCVFNSTDPKDIELIASWYYNKMEVNRFTSSAGKFVGYTEYGVKNADFWNNGPFLNTMRAEKERFCQHNIGIWYSNVLSKSVQPTVRLHSSTPSSGHHPAMLVCSVYDFFPKDIKVSWLRDGQEVSSDVTSTEEMEDSDWYYQIHSHLEYTPRQDGDSLQQQRSHPEDSPDAASQPTSSMVDILESINKKLSSFNACLTIKEILHKEFQALRESVEFSQQKTETLAVENTVLRELVKSLTEGMTQLYDLKRFGIEDGQLSARL
uniref:Ig-like domain-containing protein n=1 Tax=Amphilophus citrinellus TaxID=61819 RepID=A0A3Q0SBH4_AMPCI